MTGLCAPGFPEDAVRCRARHGTAALFPPAETYGRVVFGAGAGSAGDPLDALRLVPPVLMPGRLARLVELGREPHHGDVGLETEIGGFAARMPVYVSAFGSTRAVEDGRGVAAARQAGRLGVPIVLGENIVAAHGYGRGDGRGNTQGSLLERIRAYGDAAPPDAGGVVVQQSTEDADTEVWNLVYSDPSARDLLDGGRLGFELKLGQGAKPGLGGLTLVDCATADRLASRYAIDPLGPDGPVLRCASPGTFTADILANQVRLMRNNFPRCRTWVKLPPGRDVRQAAEIAWSAGAHAVTVDGAEGGTGLAPTAFLDHVGLPLGECLARIGRAPEGGSLLAAGRIWEGTRLVKCLALGATAAGLGRAALIAVDEDPDDGLARLLDALAMETRMLISALGAYTPADLGPADLHPRPDGHDHAR